ncbi:hypothetical protein LX36DRAFT_711848 [Colletotrichum falcatum]|nr:hypothetical protein LX36DRAFT_711848 [Colletotrichum falcatum]
MDERDNDLRGFDGLPPTPTNGWWTNYETKRKANGLHVTNTRDSSPWISPHLHISAESSDGSWFTKDAGSSRRASD